MFSVKECISMINSSLEQISYPLTPENLYDPIRYSLAAGGKRLRPVFALLACNLFKDAVEAAINPAIAIEIFHNFTLLHDDIMDKSELRRNQPTVHIKWNENVAILSGDAMLIKAYEYLVRSPEQLLPDIITEFNKVALEVCEGQQLDMDFEMRDDVSVEQYLQMIGLKTAALIAGSLKIGAICGETTNENVINLYEFGHNIGVAFQLQDDLLDVFADPKVFGKSSGNDILSNKKTFLLLTAMKNAAGELLTEINQWLSRSEFDKTEKVNAFIEIYNKLNIKQLTEDEIEKYYQKAMRYLETITVATERKKVIKEFVVMLMGRNK